MIRRVPYEHLRYRMMNSWKYLTIRFIGKRLAQVGIVQAVYDPGDSRLGIAEHCQSALFRFIQADIGDRHTASADIVPLGRGLTLWIIGRASGVGRNHTNFASRAPVHAPVIPR